MSANKQILKDNFGPGTYYVAFDKDMDVILLRNNQPLNPSGNNQTIESEKREIKEIPTFSIGQNYGGGIIYYVDASGSHGLICAKTDQSDGAHLKDASIICDTLSISGFNDWRLPSKEELNLLYLQKDVIKGFTDYYYWSSSQVNSTNSWNQYFGSGGQFDFNKEESSFYVRAVRSF